ncbi:MAG: hypothetical protein JXB34_08180 [Bacteroidales bacterium]|nr:hypothetical protein [Bacteroidales bacterium]
MTKETVIKLFNERQIRTLWDDEQEKWCFPIVDVLGVYLKVMPHKLIG